MAPSLKLTRRQVLKGTATVGALGMLGILEWIGQAGGRRTRSKWGLFLWGTRDDYGYNQAHLKANCWWPNSTG